MIKVYTRGSTAYKLLTTCRDDLCNIQSFRSLSSGTVVVTDVNAARPLEEIPGPKSLPLIGTLYNYLPWGKYNFRMAYNTGNAMFKKYGPIVREEIVPGHVIIRLFDPNDIATVCQHQGKYPLRYPIFALKRYREKRGLHGGLTTVSGTEWHRFRSLVNQTMMRLSEVATYIPAQEPVSEDFVQRICLLRNKDNEVPEFLNELYKWACESIGVVCFGQRVGTLLEDNKDAMHFINNVNKMFEALHKSMFLSFIHDRGIETKAWRDLCSALDYLSAYTLKIVDSAEKSANNKDSLLIKLLSTPGFHRDEAIVMISDLFAAGVDTTAHTMAFNLYHLAKNPDKQQKLYEEIMRVAPPGKPLDGNVTNNMSYMRAVIKETMRLTPIVSPGTMRFLDKDVVLSGYRIPAGLLRNFTVKYEHEDIGQVLRLVNMPDRPLRYAFVSRN